MKKRNEFVVIFGEEGEEEDMGDNFFIVINLDLYKFILEIKNFIFFGCSMMGKVII